jgi:hypothetical protein
METGKTGTLAEASAKAGKYFKYAIGEIILVVIGILIALSINNWNEERKKGIQGKEYVSEIYSDVKKDILRINDILEKLEINKITSRQILEILENEDKYTADSSLFVSNMLNTNAVIHVRRQNSTWDELTSSGKIAMIDNDSLDNLLKTFYEYYDKQVFQFSETPAQMREKNRTASSRCLDLSSINRYWKKGGDESYNKSWFTCILNDSEFKKDVVAIHLSTYWQIRHFAKIKAEGQSIIDYMDKTIILK